jgi:hypothetical protein
MREELAAIGVDGFDMARLAHQSRKRVGVTRNVGDKLQVGSDTADRILAAGLPEGHDGLPEGRARTLLVGI